MSSSCRNNRPLAPLALLLVLGLEDGATAQTPARAELLINAAETLRDQYLDGLNCRTKEHDCALAWGSARCRTPIDCDIALWLTHLDPQGQAGASIFLRPDDNVHLAAFVPFEEGWGLWWDQFVPPQPGTQFGTAYLSYQSLSPTLDPVAPMQSNPDPGGNFVSSAHRAPGGGMVISTTGFGLPTSPDALLRLADASGLLVGPPIPVSERPEAEQVSVQNGMVISEEQAVVTVVFDELQRVAGTGGTNVFVRRFTLGGVPLGPSAMVNTTTKRHQSGGSLAARPSGEFVVVWTSALPNTPVHGIFARRFDQDGLPLGDEFQVNQHPLADQGGASIAMDDRGNFLVVWQAYGSSAFIDWDIRARLYRADGSPVGPPVLVNRHTPNNQEAPRVAWVGDGRFLIAWESFAQIDNEDVFARYVSASPGDEACIVSKGLLVCDTGRTGGDLEIRHRFGNAPDGPFLLGDVDGDGRADPCDVKNGIFRCDSDHEGGAAEVKVAFTGPGAPLLGDVDGDGRADPCLYTLGRFSCDTHHDGGAPETVLPFGNAGETPLLGDINGDGRDDACTFKPGLFRCETKNDGGAPEVTIHFGKSGDSPLLGDFDADGDDDPCVYRGGRLLCDTSHDGGTAEGVLAIGVTGDRLVLGNLDGL